MAGPASRWPRPSQKATSHPQHSAAQSQKCFPRACDGCRWKVRAICEPRATQCRRRYRFQSTSSRRSGAKVSRHGHGGSTTPLQGTHTFFGNPFFRSPGLSSPRKRKMEILRTFDARLLASSLEGLSRSSTLPIKAARISRRSHEAAFGSHRSLRRKRSRWRSTKR